LAENKRIKIDSPEKFSEALWRQAEWARFQQAKKEAMQIGAKVDHDTIELANGSKIRVVKNMEIDHIAITNINEEVQFRSLLQIMVEVLNWDQNMFLTSYWKVTPSVSIEEMVNGL